MPAIWSVECTLGLYQDPQTCGRGAQRARGQDGSIHRQHSENVAIREPSVGAHRSDLLKNLGFIVHPDKSELRLTT